MANQFLSLSLFMMLLAFFIIMNSVSVFEDIKARSVMSSLSLAFAKNTSFQDTRSSLEDDAVNALNEGSTLDKIEALFRTQITGLEVSKNRFGTEMQITLPIRDFEEMLAAPVSPESEAALAPGKKNIFPVLLSLIDIQDETPYRMDMVLGITQNPARLQNEKPGDMSVFMKKVSTYSQIIEDMGMPRKFITSGVAEGETDTITLIFRRYTSFDITPPPAKENPAPLQEQPG